jgi:hypothetical protein
VSKITFKQVKQVEAYLYKSADALTEARAVLRAIKNGDPLPEDKSEAEHKRRQLEISRKINERFSQ